jgi:hypothetical protein
MQRVNACRHCSDAACIAPAAWPDSPPLTLTFVWLHKLGVDVVLVLHLDFTQSVEVAAAAATRVWPLAGKVSGFPQDGSKALCCCRCGVPLLLCVVCATAAQAPVCGGVNRAEKCHATGHDGAQQHTFFHSRVLTAL